MNDFVVNLRGRLNMRVSRAGPSTMPYRQYDSARGGSGTIFLGYYSGLSDGDCRIVHNGNKKTIDE